MKFAVPFHFFLCCESRAQKGHLRHVDQCLEQNGLGIADQGMRCIQPRVASCCKCHATDSHCHGTVALRSRTITSSGAAWPAGLTHRVSQIFQAQDAHSNNS